MGKHIVVAGCAVEKGKQSSQAEPGAKKQQRRQEARTQGGCLTVAGSE